MNRQRGFEVTKGFEDEEINLPKRGTKYAAGYDFEAAETIVIPSLWKNFSKSSYLVVGSFLSYSDNFKVKPVLVPTGVKAYMKEGEYLQLANRSSNSLKKNLILANGIGVIDADYYNNPDNDGHIMGQFINLGPKDITIEKGERIFQGIFQQYLTIDDEQEVTNERTGGHGSTNK